MCNEVCACCEKDICKRKKINPFKNLDIKIKMLAKNSVNFVVCGVWFYKYSTKWFFIDGKYYRNSGDHADTDIIIKKLAKIGYHRDPSFNSSEYLPTFKFKDDP